jgi:phospholipid/cholesterol/gamma-HCH transport system substrate-binding protein
MNNSKILEFGVGVLILLGLLAFMFMALKVSGLTMASNPFMSTTYQVSADFTDIGGLKVRSPVRIAGVQVGTVVAIDLNPETYEAHVIMSIEKNVALPTDSSVSITAAGILGDNYVSVTPGYARTNMASGGQFVTTYAATSLTSLISTFMSNNNSGNSKNAGGDK